MIEKYSLKTRALILDFQDICQTIAGLRYTLKENEDVIEILRNDLEKGTNSSTTIYKLGEAEKNNRRLNTMLQQAERYKQEAEVKMLRAIEGETGENK